MNMTDREEKITSLQRELERLQRENEEARGRIAAQEAMQAVARSLTSELNLDPLLHNILRSAVQVMGASAGSLMLLDYETNELVFEVIEGGGGASLRKTRIPAGKGIAGWVASTRQPLIVDDVSHDDRHYRTMMEGTSFTTHSILCVPMIARGEVIGVLQLLNKRGGGRFSESDQQDLTSFAAQSAVAIENARLYESLREERDRILAVEEEVRHRLARDLHDGPTQMLASIMMSANFVKEAIARNELPLALEELDALTPVAEKALHQVRTLLFDLRPVTLETRGLIPALRSYLQRLRKTEGVKIDLEVHEPIDRLPYKEEMAIFSIIQEALTNARKHAQAENIRICVKATQAKSLVVTITDDGVGFDVDEVWGRYDERGSLGIINMKERADIVGGQLSVASRVGHGTLVTFELPRDTSAVQQAGAAE
jgi:signal transduction histidine kinase